MYINYVIGKERERYMGDFSIPKRNITTRIRRNEVSSGKLYIYILLLACSIISYLETKPGFNGKLSDGKSIIL